jgi:RHS repeat-associated protein
VWRWDQAEPFGSNPADENPSGLGAFDLPLRLPGQRYDAETGLHYNYFRDYDPSLGRYGESDPVGIGAGLNTYLYVAASPLLYSDPQGLYIPGVHNSITYTQAMGTCLQPEASKLGNTTGDVDTLPNSQMPENSRMHSMCSGSPVSTSTCQQMIDLYIQQQLSECTLDGLALALHAIQDGFAPGHKGGQTWPGMPGTPGGISWGAGAAHFFGDLFPISGKPAQATKKTIVDWCNRCRPCKR